MTVLVEMLMGFAAVGRGVAVRERGIELAGSGGRAGGSFSSIAFRFNIVPLKLEGSVNGFMLSVTTIF